MLPSRHQIALLACVALLTAAYGEPNGNEEALNVLSALEQKYSPPKLPKIDSNAIICYRLLVLPEVITDELFPVIITMELTIDATHRAQSGALRVHARKKGVTSLVGEKQLSSKEAEETLRIVGSNELFQLPMNHQVARYELFPHFGGMRYVFIRRDREGTKVVMREDWSSQPAKSVAKHFMSFALPFFDQK